MAHRLAKRRAGIKLAEHCARSIGRARRRTGLERAGLRVSEPSNQKPLLLTREAIKAGHVQRMVAAANPSLKLLSDAEIHAALDRMLGPAPSQVWVFGYGSLIWNPAF